MKIIIIDTYYEFFLKEFYRKNPHVKELSYSEHHKQLMASRFSASDAYSHFFNKKGWESEEIIFNDPYLPAKWARENDVSVMSLPNFPTKGLNALLGWDWRFHVLRKQIEKMKPDVIYIKEQSLLTDAMVGELKSITPVIGMQVGSRLMKRRKYSDIDFVFTGVPNFVPLFKEMGLQAHYLKMCFDPRVNDEILSANKKYPVSFVGGITYAVHAVRNTILERLCTEYKPNQEFYWFGYTTSRRHQDEKLTRAWQGDAWGLAMYQALAESFVTINTHGKIEGADDYAINVRLYEATGVGACLLTDWKKNLSELFEVDKEVIAYKSVDELFDKLKFLLNHPEECLKVAQAGQARTLRDHTFKNRVEEMIPILNQYLGKTHV